MSTATLNILRMVSHNWTQPIDRERLAFVLGAALADGLYTTERCAAVLDAAKAYNDWYYATYDALPDADHTDHTDDALRPAWARVNVFALSVLVPLAAALLAVLS